MQDEMNDAMPTYETDPNDLVRVVRCKDCKRYDISKNGVYGHCIRQYAIFYPDDYCSYGERR